MFSRLGLTADQVAEIGRWKNLEAFRKHYSRLGAASVAGKALDRFFVHNTSSGGSTDTDWSRTFGTEPDQKGSDQEVEVRSTDEPDPTPPGT